MKRYLWLFAALIMASLIIGYYGTPSWMTGNLPEWFTREDEVPVRVGQARRGSVAYVVRGSGGLKSVREADVESRIAGQLDEIRFNVGDSVVEGQIIATIQAKALRQRIEKARAALKEAQANLREKESRFTDAEMELERARKFRELDLISGRDLNQAQAVVTAALAERELSKAQVEQQEATLAQSSYLLGLTRLAAPFSGVVTRRTLTPGAHMESGTVIATVGGIDPLKVTFSIPAQDRGLIREGSIAHLRIDGLPGIVFEGKASYLDPETATAEVHVPNREGTLKPGIKAIVSLITGNRKDALILPTPAVVELEGKSVVYAVVNGRAQRRSVTKGWEQDGQVAIMSGVSEGEWVVVSGQQALKPNSKLRVIAEGSGS